MEYEPQLWDEPVDRINLWVSWTAEAGWALKAAHRHAHAERWCPHDSEYGQATFAELVDVLCAEAQRLTGLDLSP